MDISRDKIMGFAGEQVFPAGSIELSIIVGEHLKQKIIMVKFLLIDRSSMYNAILGRTTLNKLKAITSTSHLKMKFLSEQGIGEVIRNQWVAKQCYNITLKDTLEKSPPGLEGKDK
jgi:hypothetical protein